MAKKKRAEDIAALAVIASDEESFIDFLLSLEEPTRAEADNYPSGPNSDAVKAALRNAAHGIAHIRKALAQVAALER